MLDLASIKSRFPVRGEKVIVRLFQEEDITDRYVSWLNDKDVNRFSNQRFREHSRASCLQYWKTFENASALFLAILSSTDGSMIGTMTVYFNMHHAVADMGIMIGAKEVWGTGVGRDAWAAVMNLLSRAQGLRKITGGTLACNQGMRKIMLATDMLEDGVRRGQEMVDGQPIDILYYAKFLE